VSERFPMTPEGHQRLVAELRHLKSVERPKNIQDIETAREHGDLKENAEYQYAKEKRLMINAHIGRAESMLGGAQVIDPKSLSGERVVFGATVTVYDLKTEEEHTWQIVGQHESDPDNGRISVTSPLARSLIGKEEGDEVGVPGSRGRPGRQLELLGVEFV
jgi:transcription elongation factor GreA